MSFDFNELKQKVVDTALQFADKSADFAKQTSERAVVLTKKAKLNAEIAKERELIKKLESQLGREYYKLFKDAPEEALSQLVGMITDSLDLIRAKKAEIESLDVKTDEAEDPDIVVDYTYADEPAPEAAEEAPADEAVEEAPAEEAPVEETTAEEAPAEEAPVEEAPAEPEAKPESDAIEDCFCSGE